MTDFRDHDTNDNQRSDVADSGGQDPSDAHGARAPAKITDGHLSTDTHCTDAVDAGDHSRHVTHMSVVPSKKSRRQRLGETQNVIATEGGGRKRDDDHWLNAPAEDSGDHLLDENQSNLVAPDVAGQKITDAQQERAGNVHSLRELHRHRQDFHRAEKAMTARIKGNCRRMVGGDKKEADVIYRAIEGKGSHGLAASVMVTHSMFFECRSGLEGARKTVEKKMEKLAKQLPIDQFVEQTKGFSWGSLAALIGETGNLGSYANPAKVWKRMGLAVMSDATRQRRVSGVDAMEHGYSPTRRAIVWNIGNCIIKAQIRNVKDDDGERTDESIAIGDYGQIYLDRKIYELDRVETKVHAHNRAKRYMEKRLMRDLWRAWRDATGESTTIETMYPVEYLDTAE